MADNSFTRQLRALVADFTRDGQILKKPIGRIIRKQLDDRRITFLVSFLELILTTDYTTKETKMYLQNRYITYEGVAEQLNAETGKNITPNTVQTKVWRDKNKIIAAFGEKILINVLEYDNIDMASYERTIARLFSKNSNVKLLNNIALNLPEAELVKQIDDEVFSDFLINIAPYTKQQMKVVSELLSVEAVGYSLFLLTSNLLEGKDIENKQRLLDLLGD